MKQQSYYMVIPSEVWDSEITARAMVLYGHIQTLTNKKKYCYANNSYFERVMRSSSSSIGRCMKELEEGGFITREFVYKEGSNEIEERKIFLTIGIVTGDNRPVVTGDQDNTTSNNNINNNIDVPSVDDIKGKLFFKLTDMYPKNRIGNRQHGLKKFKTLDIEQGKLALKNLSRYLDIAGEYVKNLQNYITEECWTEAWLKAEKETKSKKANINNNPAHNAEVFKNKDLGYYE